MKKQTVQERKNEQGYRKYGPCCSNCAYFTSEIVEYIEKNKYCILGKFVVGKSAWCKHHNLAVTYRIKRF